MAVDSGYLGDTSQSIGQGLAFVLPENKSATYAMQLAQTHAAQLQDMAKQRRVEQLKNTAEFHKEFQQQKLPEAFAPFDKIIAKAHEDWQAKWAGDFAKTGKNPFNNPDAMAEYNEKVLIPARRSKDLGDNYSKLRALAETDPNNKYTKESKQAVIDYENKIKSDPMSALDGKIPQLVETPASVNDFVKTLKPVSRTTNDGNMEIKGADSSNHKAQVFAGLMGDPKWHDVLKGYGYNPDLPDFGVYTDPQHPNGKRVWYTNPTFTGHQADLILSSPEDPKNAAILEKIGIHPGDQYAKEKLQHAITDQNAAMGRAVTEISSQLDAKVPTEQKRVFTAQNEANQQERLGMESKRLHMAEYKFGKELNDKTPFSEHMRNGVPHSGEILSEAFTDNSHYQAPLHFTSITHDGKDTGVMEVTVPPKKNPKFDPNQPENEFNKRYSAGSYKITLDPSKPGEYNSAVRELVKEAGGDKKLNEALSLQQNIPKDTNKPAQHKTSIKQSDIAAKAAAAGYTVKEYTALLKQKGIKIE